MATLFCLDIKGEDRGLHDLSLSNFTNYIFVNWSSFEF